MNTHYYSHSTAAALPFNVNEVDAAVFSTAGDALAHAQQLWYEELKSVSVLYNNKGYYAVVDLADSMELTKDKRYQLVVAYI